MTDRPTSPKARRAKGSLKEAIGKIAGDDKTVADGAAEKDAADASSRKPG